MDFETFIKWYLIWVVLYLLFEYFRSRWMASVDDKLYPTRFSWWLSKAKAERMIKAVKSRLIKPFVWFRERFL